MGFEQNHHCVLGRAKVFKGEGGSKNGLWLFMLPKGFESAITWYCSNWWSWYQDPFCTNRLISNSFRKCCTGICSSSRLLEYSRMYEIIRFRLVRELPNCSNKGQNKFVYKSAWSRITFAGGVPFTPSLLVKPEGNWLFEFPKTSKDDRDAESAKFVCIWVSKNARYSLSYNIIANQYMLYPFAFGLV